MRGRRAGPNSAAPHAASMRGEMPARPLCAGAPPACELLSRRLCVLSATQCSCTRSAPCWAPQGARRAMATAVLGLRGPLAAPGRSGGVTGTCWPRLRLVPAPAVSGQPPLPPLAPVQRASSSSARPSRAARLQQSRRCQRRRAQQNHRSRRRCRPTSTARRRRPGRHVISTSRCWTPGRPGRRPGGTSSSSAAYSCSTPSSPA